MDPAPEPTDYVNAPFYDFDGVFEAIGTVYGSSARFGGERRPYRYIATINGKEPRDYYEAQFVSFRQNQAEDVAVGFYLMAGLGLLGMVFLSVRFRSTRSSPH